MEGDGLFLRRVSNFGQVVKGLLLCFEAGLGACNSPKGPIRCYLLADGLHRNPLLVRALIDAALSVPTAFGLSVHVLLDAAGGTELAPIWDFPTAFSAFHIAFTSYYAYNKRAVGRANLLPFISRLRCW